MGMRSILACALFVSLIGCESDSTLEGPAEDMGMDLSSVPDMTTLDMTSGIDSTVNEDAGLDMMPRAAAPIFITTMTHLEGAWDYTGPRGERKFQGDVGKIRLAMETFTTHGAKLTIESEIPFSTTELEMRTGIFSDLLDAGHGVGTHCDIRPNAPRVDAEDYALEFSSRKAPMDMLIGAENNLGCSGGQGRSDWILGAHLAGFKFIDGTVAFGFLSMLDDDRPDGWTDEYILDEGHFHDNIPLDLVDRIHPYMMADATDMVPDPDDGVVLLSSGGMGRLDAQTESAAGASCNPNCEYDDQDVETAIQAIENALTLHDPSRVGKLDFYFPLANFSEPNLPYISAFLERVDREFIQTGRLQWATQRELYDAYQSWSSQNEGAQ